MLGKAIQVQLKKVGIHLEFEAGTRTDLFEQVVLPKVTGALSWQKDLFLFACPDPMYHYAFIHSVATFSGGPFTLWRSQQYDDVFRRFTQELDDGKALGLARQLDQILAAELPWIPLIQMRKGYGVRTGVDYVPTRSGMLDLRQAHWTTDTRSAR